MVIFESVRRVSEISIFATTWQGLEYGLLRRKLVGSSQSLFRNRKMCTRTRESQSDFNL